MIDARTAFTKHFLMKTLTLICALLTLGLHAAEFNALAAFGILPECEIAVALERAQCENKCVLLATYDTKGDYNHQGLQIKYFTDLKETKRLLQENFILVMLDRNDQAVTKYSKGINLERPHYFLLSPTGDKIKDDTLCANPEDGLRRTKIIIDPNDFALRTKNNGFDPVVTFGSAQDDDIGKALNRAQKENKRVLLATYDSTGDYNNQGLQLKYFTGLKETKQLIQENFIVVLLDCSDKALAQYSEGINLERPHYFLLSPAGEKIKDDTLCANPEDGLRRTKAIVALP